MENKELINLSNYSMEDVSLLCGIDNRHLQIINDNFKVQIVLRNNEFTLIYQDKKACDLTRQVIEACFTLLKHQKRIQERDVQYLCKLAILGKMDLFINGSFEIVGKTANGKFIYPKTIGQRILVDKIKQNDIVFASGVAGTGKTYLSVVYAVNLYKKGEINKIILTRPAVEAGESLGFLPGDLKEKVDPYLRPLYDALDDTLGKETCEKLIEKEVIEIAPLAYMRGRTLDNAFIILDEAQNTTKAQMKMFLTRMGFSSKIVITGDITQIDLIKKADCGLNHAKMILKDVKGIGFVELNSLDVVRHPLVQKIIECYESEDHNHD